AAKVVALRRKQAGVERSVGREARPRAVRAERLRDRGDHADLAAAVAIAPSLGDLAGVVLLDRLQWQLAIDRRDDLTRGDDVIQPPAVGRTDVHVLDEPEDATGAAEKPRHR